MKFQYKAKNKEGAIQSGTVVAGDQAKAEQLLVENGLVIISFGSEEDRYFGKV